MLPLQGIKVIEFEGLAPTVFMGMVLSDFGADVTIINKIEPNIIGIDSHQTFLNRGKKSIALSLSNKFHQSIIKQMIMKADIVIDCYRPGVLEKFGLGSEQMLKLNEKLIFARVTGYGQTGSLSQKAGHDINYLGYSGVLSTFGQEGYPPFFPGNILADFAGGGSFGVIGVLLALFERSKTGKGQIIDVAMHEAVGYLGSFLQNMKINQLWNNQRGSNMLDGGAPFYRCYQCKCGKYMAVGSIEPKFYQQLIHGLGFKNQEFDQYIDNQMNLSKWKQMQDTFEKIFMTKTRQEWTEIFDKLDCCVTPVLEMSEIQYNKQWIQRQSIIMQEQSSNFEIGVHPKLSNHKQQQVFKKPPLKNQDRIQILKEYGINENIIKNLEEISPKL